MTPEGLESLARIVSGVIVGGAAGLLIFLATDDSDIARAGAILAGMLWRP